MNIKFRALRADEVEARVSTVSEKGCSLLLYKDARCDMNILDETVGCLNWTRHHSRDNANCTVAIYDSDKQMWVEKEDTGTESYTEKEKGLASDSFKRACFNFGIGRELYTAPFIWIPASECRIVNKNGKPTCYDRFDVRSMVVENGRITAVSIYNTATKKVCYSYGTPKNEEPDDYQKNAEMTKAAEASGISEAMIATLKKEAKRRGVAVNSILQRYKKEAFEDMTVLEFKSAMRILEKMEVKAS